MRPLPSAILLPALLLLGTCHRHEPAVVQSPQPASARAFYADSFSRKPTVPEMTELGRKLFFDASLSASGRLACASCHDPRFAYGPPDGVPVRNGGGQLDTAGVRAVPSLRYVQNVPSFAEHYFDEGPAESEDAGPTGGHTWDGRADSVHDQAQLPLLSPGEMANVSPEAIMARVEQGPLAAQFRAVYGNDVFSDRDNAFKALLKALEVFQQSPPDFYPYNSRYDDWLRGTGKLSAQELRGLALFNDERKGNCASCHPGQIKGGAFPQFTDFGYAALGVPRNDAIPANRDGNWHDLGLCGPLRKDFATRAEYCGLFRVPPLRNVALRRVFFHNGQFHELRRVVEFYVSRDLHPERWYSKDGTGRPQPYDDLPQAYRVNVNSDPPFDRKPGTKPALSADEIDAVVAFLGTLTDADLLPAQGSGAVP